MPSGLKNVAKPEMIMQNDTGSCVAWFDHWMKRTKQNIAKQDMVFAKRHKKLRRLVRQWMKRINSLCRLTEIISRFANFLYYYSKPLKSM